MQTEKAMENLVIRPINPKTPLRPKRPFLKIRYPEGDHVQISALNKLPTVTQIIVLKFDELEAIMKLARKELRGSDTAASRHPDRQLAIDDTVTEPTPIAVGMVGFGTASTDLATATVGADPVHPAGQASDDQPEPPARTRRKRSARRSRQSAGDSASTKLPPDKPARRKRSSQVADVQTEDDAPPEPVSGSTT